MDQISSSEMKFGSVIFCQNSGELTLDSQSAPGRVVQKRVESPPGETLGGSASNSESLRRQYRRTGPFIQPSRCTPLVMWPMGTSSTHLPGYKLCHIWRLILPCNSLTPLAAREAFRART